MICYFFQIGTKMFAIPNSLQERKTYAYIRDKNKTLLKQLWEKKIENGTKSGKNVKNRKSKLI